MRYIGFIERFDKYNPTTKALSALLTDRPLDTDLRSLLIAYLKNGQFLSGWMSFLRDEDGSPIGNNDYLTDGEYIWPAYYIYFLEKHTDLSIDDRFIEHVQQNKFVMPQLSKQELSDMERRYEEERFGFVKAGKKE